MFRNSWNLGKINMNFLLFSILVLPSLVIGITTTHHNKPSPAQQQQSRKLPISTTLPAAERQKRLLPYYNFYADQELNRVPSQRYKIPVRLQVPKANSQRYNHQTAPSEAQQILYESKQKFTPFLESNALPGPFIPMVKNPPQTDEIDYTIYQTSKLPNYSSIYDKLSQLKLVQQARPQLYNYRIVPQYQQEYRKPQQEGTALLAKQPQYAPQPHKTIIQTYTPTDIEISTTGADLYDTQVYKNPSSPKPIITNEEALKIYLKTSKPYAPIYFTTKEPEQFVNQDHALPITLEEQIQYNNDQKQYVGDKTQIKRPIIISTLYPVKENVQNYPEEVQQVQKPVVFIQNKPSGPIYQPQQKLPILYPEITERPVVLANPTALEKPDTEPANALNAILKKLQASNALPQTITADNIDNSIKTLVRILTTLKKQQKFSKPIVVADESTEYEEDDVDNEAGVGIGGHPQEVPGTVIQTFPADTEEGGTPGKPGVDYPALSTIPQTSFNCKTQRYKGFFGDPDTNCQVWHYCDLNGGQASFLCPNGTIFSQVALTCDWWYNVKCATTAQLYVLNERLYKYILPFSPKFPEDYSGPLVDKYLALKFKEMEEKMRKQKKGKQEAAEKADKEKEEQEEESNTETSETITERETAITLEETNQ